MDKQLSWSYAEAFTIEPPAIVEARQHAHEFGIDSVSAAVGAQLAVLAAVSKAKTILEVGTGTGVSGLWLLSGATDAVLTSIDAELDHQSAARAAFQKAGVPERRARLIAGRALDVLPRMTDEAYDLVFIDADPPNLLGYVEHALRVAKPGGLVLVAHALWHDQVPDPVKRDGAVSEFRALLQSVMESATAVAALSSLGDGLLQLVKR